MSIFSQDDIDLVHCAGNDPPDSPCEQLLPAGRGPPLVELQRGPVHALQPGAVHLNLQQTCRPCLTMHGMNKDLLCYVESFYLGFNLLKALSTFPLLAHLQRSISEDLRRWILWVEYVHCISNTVKPRLHVCLQVSEHSADGAHLVGEEVLVVDQEHARAAHHHPVQDGVPPQRDVLATETLEAAWTV